MAAPKAAVLGGAAKDVALSEEIFGADVPRHLLHETVRAELNARRAGTRGAKTRGLVSGGRAKPWRQKGTGRARQGTTRAPQFTGGGVVFAPGMRSFDVKVNRKARRAALRGALSHHAENGTIGLVDGSAFETPSTKQAWDRRFKHSHKKHHPSEMSPCISESKSWMPMRPRKNSRSEL